MKQASACALLINWASAAIAQNGLWTDQDWYDDTQHIGAANGIPYSNDAAVERRITAPKSIDGNVEDMDYLNFENVQRVQRFFNQTQWNEGFPLADPVYTYQNFLKAVAKFPAFCGESNLSNLDLDETCKRELSTIFAHWGQETGARDPSTGLEFWQQGLYWVQEIRCNGTNDPSCDYKSYNWSNDAWPNQNG